MVLLMTLASSCWAFRLVVLYFLVHWSIRCTWSSLIISIRLYKQLFSFFPILRVYEIPSKLYVIWILLLLKFFVNLWCSHKIIFSLTHFLEIMRLIKLLPILVTNKQFIFINKFIILIISCISFRISSMRIRRILNLWIGSITLPVVLRSCLLVHKLINILRLSFLFVFLYVYIYISSGLRWLI